MGFFGGKIFKRTTNFTLVFVIALSSLTALGPLFLSERANAVDGAVVNSSAMNGWAIRNQDTSTVSGSFVVGPSGVGSLGNGSYNINSPLGKKMIVYNPSTSGDKLNTLSQLKYSTYVTNRDAGTKVAPAININAIVNSKWTTLVYEPTYSGDNTTTGQWQTWDTLNGKWWSTKDLKDSADTVVVRAFDDFVPWTTITGLDSNAIISGDGTVSGVQIVVGQNSGGSPWSNFSGGFDAVNIKGTVYNFEPLTPDTQRPAVSFFNPTTNGQAFKGNLNVQFQANDNDLLNTVTVNIKDRFNSGNLGTCGTASSLNVPTHTLNCTIDTNIFADGTYYLRGGATDVSGNNKTISTQVIFDNTRPTNTITSPLANSTQPGTFTITGKAVDATSGIDYAHVWVTKYTSSGTFGGYLVDEDVSVDAGGNYQLSITLPHNEGPYGYRVHSAAYDKAGNVQNTQQRPIYVDTEAPNISLVAPLYGAVMKGASLTQAWNSTSSDVAKYIYQSYNDEAMTSHRWTEEFPASVTSKTATNVADATFWWKVTAVDALGNQSTSPLWKVVVDNTAPVVAITNPTGSLFNTDVEVLGTVTDANLRHYWVQVKRNGLVVFSNTVLSTGISNAPLYAATLDGDYTVTLAARDTAGGGSITGNRSIDVVKSFTIDKTLPTVPSFIMKDSNGNIVTNGYITTQYFTVNLMNPLAEGVVRYQLKYSNGFNSVVWNPSDLSATGHMSTLGVYTDNFTQGEGTHNFAFSACDAAGNCSPFTSTFVVNYDKTPPVVDITDALDGITVGNNSLVAITGNSGDVVSYTISVEGLAINGGVSFTSYNWDTTGLISGIYEITLDGVDAAGNPAVSDSVFITVDNTAPILTAIGYTGTDLTPTITGTTDGATDTVAVDGDTATVSPIVNGSGTYDWTYTLPTQTVGAHTITIVSTDDYGNETSTTANVLVEATPTSSPAAVTATPNVPLAFIPAQVADNGQVLGETTTTPAATDTNNGDTDVAGATDDQADTGDLFGLAWYWYLAVLAALGLLWSLIAAWRRRSEEQ